MKVQLESSWNNVLEEECKKSYFIQLMAFVHEQYQTGAVHPSKHDIFNAFSLTPYNTVKVVLLGQDPYHGPEQAHGLSFSVQRGVRNPPSLQNIFKEVATDTGYEPDTTNGDLTRWAQQGVLLLNSVLTVREGIPGSHQGKGWEEFTEAVIQKLSDQREHLVFILWGNYARTKGAHIDRNKHLILESAHPSPLSAYKGFFGSKPFTKANTYLKHHRLREIDWR